MVHNSCSYDEPMAEQTHSLIQHRNISAAQLQRKMPSSVVCWEWRAKFARLRYLLGLARRGL
jgi:hypothetical protein